MTFLSVNANHLSNKMTSLMHTTYSRNLDVVHITEAGLGTKLPQEIKGYKAIKLEHESPNRGSEMYLKEEYYNKMVRIQEPEDQQIGSEIIHILLNKQPHTNIIGVYQKTNITIEEADKAHKVFKNKVRERRGLPHY